MSWPPLSCTLAMICAAGRCRPAGVDAARGRGPPMHAWRLALGAPRAQRRRAITLADLEAQRVPARGER